MMDKCDVDLAQQADGYARSKVHIQPRMRNEDSAHRMAMIRLGMEAGIEMLSDLLVEKGVAPERVKILAERALRAAGKPEA